MAEKRIVANFQIEAQSAKQELASLRSAEEDFIKAGHALTTDLTNGFGEVEKGIGKAFDKIDSGGKVSQGQFDALVAKLATMKEAIENAGVPLDQIPEQFTKALSTGEKQVAALSGAMDAARLRTESLKEEFAKAGVEAAELAQKTATAGERIEDAAKRADASFAKFTTTLQENPKEALEQLPRVAAAVIQLRQEIERTQATGGVVEAEDIARLQQFETRLVETRESAKRLGIEINAATGGTGARIDGITDAVQGLAGAFGPAGQAVGDVAGKIGTLAMGAERAKDVLGGMNLNTISLTSSTAAMGLQMGAVGAVLAASVAAGTKLAETNVENRQTIDDLKESLSELSDTLVNDLKTSLDGVQMSAQNALASIANGEWKDAQRDLEAMSVTWENGRDAGKLYYDLINRGVGAIEASRVASNENREAVDLYTKAMTLGAGGARAWNEAVENSGGTAAGLARELAVLKIDLEEESRISAIAAEMMKNGAKAREDAAAKTREHAAAVRDYVTAEQLSNEVATEASMKSLLVQQATNGTTEAINTLVRSISSMADESDRNSVALGALAAQLQNTLNQTDGLTKAERDRIQALVEMVKNANELTDAEQKRAIALAEGIVNGTAATAALKEQAGAVKDLATATAEVAQATADAATANDLYRSSIEQELAMVQAELEARGLRRDLTQQQTQINMDAGVSTDYLLQKERALAEQVAGPSLSSWSGASVAKKEQVSATAELSALIEQEKAATAGLTTATSALKVSHEQGIVTIKQANSETSTYVKTLEDGRKTITNLSEAQKAAGAAGITLAEGMKNIKLPAAEAAEVIRGLDSAVASLSSNLGSLESRIATVNQKLRDMKDAANEAAGPDAPAGASE